MINRIEAYLHACQCGCIYNCAPLALTQPLLCPNSIPLVFRKDVKNVLNVFWYLSEALLFGKIRAVMLNRVVTAGFFAFADHTCLRAADVHRNLRWHSADNRAEAIAPLPLHWEKSGISATEQSW